MKRYLVFAGDHYYPLGGFNDFIGDFTLEAEAINTARSSIGEQHKYNKNDWAHVYDTIKRKEVIKLYREQELLS